MLAMATQQRRAHTKDEEDPAEVQLPGGDRLLVVLRVGKSRE